jgi:hypothetical protein
MNQKYNNLTTLMTTGKLNWAGDPITASLMTGVVFDATDVTLPDTGGMWMQTMPIIGRSVDSDGNLIGGSVSFSNMPKDTEFQMLILKDFGPSMQPQLLAFYDVDEQGDPLTLKNNGTLIVRPQGAMPDEGSGDGIWVAI